MYKVSAGIALLLLLASTLSWTIHVAPVGASQLAYPKMHVAPAYFRTSPLTEYSVNILVDPVENVWSYNITLHFNNTLAVALDFVDGGFLNQPYQTNRTINNSTGIMQFGATELDDAQPVTSGSPPALCKAIFRATSVGRDIIGLEAQLFDKNGSSIPVDCEDGIVDQQIPPGYVYASSFSDYCPSGMPDFDQHQNQWDAYCCPTATADALWWLDSKHETLNNSSPQPPPAISDKFSLVTSYNASYWDDHDPRNVQPLIQEVAFLMDTNGQRTGTYHYGTGDIYRELAGGIAQYLQRHGVNPPGDVNGDGIVDAKDESIVQAALDSSPGSPHWDLRADLDVSNYVNSADFAIVQQHMGEKGTFSVNVIHNPSFEEIRQQFELGNAVTLDLQFYFNQMSLGGHDVALAGLNSTTQEIVIHDPSMDAYESNRSLGQPSFPHSHPSGEQRYTVHNDAQYVSNDAYVVENSSTGCRLTGYTMFWIDDYTGEIVLTPPAEWRIEWAITISYIPLAEHDIALANISPYQTVVGQTFSTPINITVENKGKSSETFNVTVYVNATEVAKWSNITLANGNFAVLCFSWNTSAFAKGNYTLWAYAWPVLGETNIADNNRTHSIPIHVGVPGDVSSPALGAHDGMVNMSDINYLVQLFNSRPGSAKWNPNADVNGDGICNMRDINIAIVNFNKHE